MHSFCKSFRTNKTEINDYFTKNPKRKQLLSGRISKNGFSFRFRGNLCFPLDFHAEKVYYNDVKLCLSGGVLWPFTKFIS